MSELASPATRWAWAEISRNAIRANARAFKGRLTRGTRLMCVVKADAYGHGAVECARLMESAGADAFGVATVDEGVALRRSGVFKPIVILAEPPLDAIPAIVEADLQPAAWNEDFVLALGEAADQAGTQGHYHLAVDTGMTRVGLQPEEVVAFREAVGWHRGVECAGTFTHFATADVPGDWDFQMQVRRFEGVIANLRQSGLDPGLVHCANTAATLLHPETHFDMVRVGIGLYGLHPADATRRVIELEPAMSVRARVSRVARPATGAGVSYGLTYRVSLPNTQVATIPVGYADGYSRALSNRVDVLVGGRRYPQVGNICMDQCMFAVDANPARSYGRMLPVAVGDVVTLMGRDGDDEISADQIAATLHTINYEVCCDFGLRLEKVYV